MAVAQQLHAPHEYLLPTNIIEVGELMQDMLFLLIAILRLMTLPTRISVFSVACELPCLPIEGGYTAMPIQTVGVWKIVADFDGLSDAVANE